MVRASHILIAYQGAERSAATRTREEALELAEALKDSVWSGELAFDEAARRYSDCPSGQEGGDLGPFSRHVMTPAFEDAAFGIGVNDISDVTETPFGYHLIMRTE
ncbi:MAG: parvulin peptidyl-prolyl isomerase [Candidatus Aegiribacteria sp. MLS_C]|nr:MAG: parvulin peptidyl-prolyl isomerase [Candidatus Aegiribacteria sp. MLS_C]